MHPILYRKVVPIVVPSIPQFFICGTCTNVKKLDSITNGPIYYLRNFLSEKHILIATEHFRKFKGKVDGFLHLKPVSLQLS